MQAPVSRRTFITWCIIMGLGGLFLPHRVLAESDLEIMRGAGNTDFFEVQSRIMEVDPLGCYLIVAEKKVELVDFRKGSQRFKTMLKNAEGETIAFRSFQKGQSVFVRGFELPDDRIAAREIYKLPGMVNRSDFHKYRFFEMVPAWEPIG